LSNQIGNYFKAKGFQKNSTVALLMETRVEYSSVWLGLSKIGCITALINTNLRKETLVHSIKVANSKAIVVSTELSDALIEIMDTDESIRDLDIFLFDPESTYNARLTARSTNLHQELKAVSSTELTFDIQDNSPSDKLFYIYTSGTTGLPKAAVITNLRFMFMVMGELL